MGNSLTLKVNPTKQFFFTPDTLTLLIGDVDVINQLVRVNFFLSNSAQKKAGYESRYWIDQGTIMLPLSVAANLKNPDGSLNADVVNQALANFNLTFVSQLA